MIEGNISELIKWYIYMMLVFGALALFMFVYQIGQTNRFSSFVAAEIERGGVQVVGHVVTDDRNTHVVQTLGFTPEADARIREENESNYDGRYTVSLKNEIESDTVLKYGDLVDYEVVGLYEILFDWFSAPILRTNDQAIVQVRMAGSDGEQVFVKSMFDYEDFIYQDVDGVGILAGFSSQGRSKYQTLNAEGLIGDFIAPDKNPKSNVTITHIADSAFAGYSFNGDFIAPNVKVVGKRAFIDSSGFTGDFNAPNILKIDDYAFMRSKFTGDFVAESVSTIGSGSFRDSVFNGTFNATRTVDIGSDSFRNSAFSGSFNAPFVLNIGSNAYLNSKFEGYFNAPKVEYIGDRAFSKSDFLNGRIQGTEFIEQ